MRDEKATARRGANWLDEYYGGIEWAGQINLEEFYPGDLERVLGQLDSFEAYGLTVEEAISLGFVLEWGAPHKAWYAEVLERTYRLALKDRLALEEEDRRRQQQLSLA